MPTPNQVLGAKGEIAVVRWAPCPRCKRSRTFKRLPSNFKCADVICDFCGFLAQVKAKTVKRLDSIPPGVPGAAWKPQSERMAAGIYFPLFLVLMQPRGNGSAIYYLSADHQVPGMFRARKPLAATAKRAGWRGFMCCFDSVRTCFVKIPSG